jgi:hypothetical protein
MHCKRSWRFSAGRSAPILVFVLIILVFLQAAGQTVVNATITNAGGNPPRRGSALMDQSGDHPLTTLLNWTGHGGTIVSPVACGGIFSPTGSIVVTGFPSGSSIVYAYLGMAGYTDFDSVQARVTFGGVDLGAIQPTSVDLAPMYNFAYYRWDVSSLPIGNGVYNFEVSDSIYTNLVFLFIVYENSLSPLVHIVANDGCESLANASTLSMFSGFEAVDGHLKLLTMCGDSASLDNECIEFNGDTLFSGQNLFCGNIGRYADYFDTDIPNLRTENSLRVITGEDWIGVHLAVLESEISSHADDVVVPGEFFLNQNYPNPFNPATTISFGLDKTTSVRIQVLDMLGRTVATLHDGVQPAGTHSIPWDCPSCASGTYLLRMRAADRILTKKMLLVK